MPHETYRVADLPFDPSPSYSRKWTTPPDDWYAQINPSAEQFPDDFIGSSVIFTASDPREFTGNSVIEALGMIVVREDNTEFDSTYEYLTEQSVANGTVLGKFEYFPYHFQREFPEGSQYPTRREAKKAANAFVYGIRVERGLV